MNHIEKKPSWGVNITDTAKGAYAARLERHITGIETQLREAKAENVRLDKKYETLLYQVGCKGTLIEQAEQIKRMQPVYDAAVAWSRRDQNDHDEDDRLTEALHDAVVTSLDPPAPMTEAQLDAEQEAEDAANDADPRTWAKTRKMELPTHDGDWRSDMNAAYERAAEVAEGVDGWKCPPKCDSFAHEELCPLAHTTAAVAAAIRKLKETP